MTLKLKNGAEFVISAMREELVAYNGARYWDMRIEMTSAVNSGVIESSFTPEGICEITASAGAAEKVFTGYASVESAGIVYNPLTLESITVIRLRKPADSGEGESDNAAISG